MSDVINIDIQRTGFPVKVGSIELFFDSSLENLRRFFDIDNLVNEKLKVAQEKALAAHLPEDITVENLDIGIVDTAMDVNKEAIAAQYDIVFGEGTFERIYGVYPDVLALEQTFEVVGVAIGKRLEELEEERSEKTSAKKAEYLTKKLLKK